MNIGLYQSAAAISALERWQDAVSQNISNSGATAYKKKTIQFTGSAAGKIQTNSADRLELGEGRQTVFPNVSFGIDFAPGESSPTRRDLDLAIQSEGFFAIQLPNGDTGYTRSGEFHLRPDRTLVNGGGLEVLGDSGNPIQLTNANGAVTITKNGAILQGAAQIGKLTIYKFTDNNRLKSIGGGMYSANGMDAEAVEKPDILQGSLEQSNITPLREMMELVTISRAYEANQKMISSRDGTFQKTLEALG
ncbi:MAG: flagellar hook-basal body protein [Opitutae bacterium]|nr:flagellar hook-basal body protein [Opitutae bacterium]